MCSVVLGIIINYPDYNLIMSDCVHFVVRVMKSNKNDQIAKYIIYKFIQFCKKYIKPITVSFLAYICLNIPSNKCSKHIALHGEQKIWCYI